MVGITLLLLLISSPADFSLHGTVRASGSGEPIAGALVEVLRERQHVWSDSSGEYALDVSEGWHTLRVSRLGYEERTLEVFVGDVSVTRLDISLTPRPLRLKPVKVVAGTTRPPNGTAPREDDSRAEIGARKLAGDWLHANPSFGDADVLQTLTVLPDVVGRPEAPSAVHIRGGSGDQNLLLLDGVPLFNAYHAAGTLSALNPDVVSSVTVHAGVPPARFGNALSGVVTVQTREQDSARWTLQGALGSLSLRQTVSGPLPALHGSFIVSGRRSTSSFLANALADRTSDFGDLIAKGTLAVGRGDLELLSFGSRDHLAFEAQVDSSELAPPAESGGEGTSHAESTSSTRPLLNGFRWSSGTRAVVWRSARGSATGFEARAWHTQFDATADWAPAPRRLRLASALTNIGVGGQASWRLASTLATAGLTAERIRTRYTVRYAAPPSPSDTIPELLALTSSPLLVWAFVEDQWRLGERWTFAAGLRNQLARGRALDVEPRLSMRFEPTPWLALLAGYARAHQYVQSLRNEESLLDAVVGIDFPAAVGTSGVPVGRSDQIALTAEARLGARTAVSLDAYARRLDGLLLVAPATAQPFATEHFVLGSGEASGATLLLEHHGDRLSGYVGYGYTNTSREAGDQSYRPSFTGTHALTVGAGYRPQPRTTLRAALMATTERPASLLAGDLEFSPLNSLGGPGDLAGSPQRIVGSLNGERISPYVRVDVGIRHTWLANLFRRSANFTGVLNVSNVLGRANALGATLSEDGGTRRALLMSPRGVTFGIEWTY